MQPSQVEIKRHRTHSVELSYLCRYIRPEEHWWYNDNT